MKTADQLAAEAAEAYYKYEADAWDIYLGHRDKLQAIIKTAIEKATEPKDKALLRIFEWASRNAPYPECKIEGNTLLQDICERGLGYWPPSRAARETEQEAQR